MTMMFFWSQHSLLRREGQIMLMHSCAERVVALCCLVLMINASAEREGCVAISIGC
jgi:hypothetical protein